MEKGEIYKTNNCGDLVIVGYITSLEVIVRFIKTGYETKARATAIRNGWVKDPLYPSVYGVGYLGVGEYKAKINGKQTKEYGTWFNMLERCYCEKKQKRRPTYKGCYVCKEWYNFQVFSEWYFDCLAELNPEAKYQLDKDILFQGNKVYSPDTCCLVTCQINSLLTYKQSTKGLYPTGVCLCKLSGKFKASLKIKGNTKNLGYYPTSELAEEAYIKSKELHIKEQTLISYTNNEMIKETYESLMKWKLIKEV